MKLVYEDKSDEIDEVLSKFRFKWQLNALSWLDYDDIAQTIRLHIFKKWDKWDQERPFKPWVSVLISNQIKNQIRNHYSNFAKPCSRCQYNMGGEACGLNKSGFQSTECTEYAKWNLKKKNAYNIKIPLSIENKTEFRNVKLEDDLDFKQASERLHVKIMEQLNERHQEVYRMIFIEGHEDKDVAKKLGFKPDPSKKNKITYKQINNLKKRFCEMANEVLFKEDIV